MVYQRYKFNVTVAYNVPCKRLAAMPANRAGHTALKPPAKHKKDQAPNRGETRTSLSSPLPAPDLLPFSCRVYRFLTAGSGPDNTDALSSLLIRYDYIYSHNAKYNSTI